MWSRHNEFEGIITAHRHVIGTSPVDSLCKFLNRIKTPLRRLNKDHFFRFEGPATQGQKEPRDPPTGTSTTP